MGFNEVGQRSETAEETHETTKLQDLTFLDNLRGFVNKHKLVMGIVAGIATPVTLSNCSVEPQVVKAPEVTADFGLGLQILTTRDEVTGKTEMMGVKVFSDLNEPLTDTSIDLIDQDGNIIYSASYPIAVGEREESTFIDPAYAADSHIAIENADSIRLVVVKGHDENGNLVQSQRPVNLANVLDDDPFPNE